MERIDGRRYTAKAQEERRRIAVKMKESGSSLDEIKNTIGLCHSSICLAWKRYLADGEAGLKTGQRGRAKGAFRHLLPEQEKHIKKIIVDKLPEQLKLDFALWTREAVLKIIKQETGIQMPIRTVGEYLKRWGFTPQKPLKFAYEQKPEIVKKWLEVDYPKISAKAKKIKAEIYWADETGLRSGDVRGRGYSPKGQTPIIQATAKYENLSMVSAITNKGRVHWMIIDGTVDNLKFIDFLKGLIKYSRVKIFLILDNLRVHHSKLVTAWVKDNNERIELFFLPAYSPDLNPDEHLNSDLKYGIGSRIPSRSKKNLSKAAEEHLQMLYSTPERIVKYFDDPAISYAAM
jgi:transposase